MLESRKVARSLEILRNDGVVPLSRSSKSYLANTIEDYWLKYKYRLEYGALAPKPNERFWVDPRTIEYNIYSKRLYAEDRNYPNYGILGGEWDRHKNHWRDSDVWDGLRQRFEEGLPWEETTYYQKALEQLEAGDPIHFVDAPQTREGLDGYLESLDELYADIKQNGYDPSSVITVHIGREGGWIVGQGNHRRTISHIVGVDAVPVRVKYRHEQWQERRRRFHEAESLAELPDSSEFSDHPDIPDV